MVELLPSMYKALSSTLSTTEKTYQYMLHVVPGQQPRVYSTEGGFQVACSICTHQLSG